MWLCLLVVLTAQGQDVVHPKAEILAKAQLVRGQRLYDEGHYTQAVQAFERAYALVPSPGLLPLLADAHEAQGELAPAIEALERYLPLAPRREQPRVEERIAALKERATAGYDGQGGAREAARAVPDEGGPLR
jgi:tetratricopeptide (TPR) repeat protein